MSKLNILGAQRVKALTEMLNEKERQAIAVKRKEQNTSEQAKKIVDAEFGIVELRNKFKELKKELLEVMEEIRFITGESTSFNASFSAYGGKQTEWYVRYQEAQAEGNAEIEQIKKDFADKKNQLWLCETLDEAKELVGV